MRRETVFFATCSYDERVHRGILRFARTRGWRVKLMLTHDWEHLADTQAAGVISLMETEEVAGGMTEHLLRRGLPWVELSLNRPERELPRLLPDLEEAGREAGRCFSRLGLERWASISYGETWHDDMREEGFREMAGKHGAAQEILHLRECGGRTAESIARFLDGISRPYGVFCSFDKYAAIALDHALERRWKIPEEIAILGCYNHELDSALAEIPISSIDLDLETRGYHAAEMLEGLMAGKPGTRSPVPPQGWITRSPIRGIVERATTCRSARRADVHVEAAVAWIASSLHLPIQVEDVMQAAGVSRSALQRRFERMLGHGVGKEIIRLRIEKAKRLLEETNMKASAIAEETGFPDAAGFYRTFKREAGVTAGSYRKSKK